MPPKPFRSPRLRVVANVAIAWTVWFFAKVAIDKFWLHQDVLGDVSHRLSVAFQSTSHSVFAFYAFFRSMLVAILHWTDVVLPFIQDSWYLLKEYVEPFLRVRVIIPLSTFLAPVPIFVWGYSKVAWTWFHNTVPLEYRLAMMFTVVLLWNRRIDPFLKTQIVACMVLLLVYRFVSRLLLNHTVMLAAFIGIPAAFALHATTTINIKPNRLSNLVLYFAILPAGIWAEWKLNVSQLPVLGLLSTSVAYSFVGSWAYWMDQDWFSSNFRSLINNTGFLPRIKPAVIRAFDFVEARVPVIRDARRKLETLRSQLTLNTVALSALSSNNIGLLSKVLAVIKSTPVITLLVTLVVVVLAILYWLHSAMSKMFLFGLYPWWFLETVKVCLYQRREEYQRQLAFTLLFLGLESFLIINQEGFIPFVFNMFHIPIVLVIRVFPVLMVQLLSKLFTFVPVSMIKLLPAKRHQVVGALASEPLAQIPANIAPIDDQTAPKSPLVGKDDKVSVRKRRSTKSIS